VSETSIAYIRRSLSPVAPPTQQQQQEEPAPDAADSLLASLDGIGEALPAIGDPRRRAIRRKMLQLLMSLENQEQEEE
jgi:hypothetical protein